MTAIKYEEAMADRNYLFDNYGQPYDMTGGYVEGEHFEKLLRNPTKSAARDECINQIDYWFSSGVDLSESSLNPKGMRWPKEAAKDARVHDINLKYGCDNYYLTHNK